jgi:hypothetical protein
MIAQQTATAVLRRKMVFVRKSLLLVPAFKQSVPSLGYTVLFGESKKPVTVIIWEK